MQWWDQTGERSVGSFPDTEQLLPLEKRVRKPTSEDESHILVGKKCLWLLSKDKRHIFIFTKNFIEQPIHPFVPLPSDIFQATS